MSLGERIAEARKKQRLTQAQVARHFSIAAVNVSQWESGTTRPDMAKMPDLAKLLGVTVDWLMAEDTEQGKIHLESAPFSPHPGPEFVPGSKDFPVLGSAEAGDGTYTMDLGVPIDFVVRPVGLANRRDAYGIYVQGDSMDPVYASGDLVYVDPRRPWMVGRDHIIQLKQSSEGDAMRFVIKRLVKRVGAKWHFKQFNPEREIVLDDKQIAAVHLILKNHEMLRS